MSPTATAEPQPSRRDGFTARSLEVLFFSAAPWLIVLACTLAYWPLIYRVTPIFFPLSTYPYYFGMVRKTIFHLDRYGVHADILYSLLVGFITAYIANRMRRPTPPKIIGIYAVIVVLGALVCHGVAFLLALEFFMDTP